MKTAIYIEDGVVQLVITPETEFEKNALSTFEDRELDARIFSGSFYDCRGGWVRQSAYRPPQQYGVSSWVGGSDDRSLMIRLDTEKDAS